jgi:hypothetical protein
MMKSQEKKQSTVTRFGFVTIRGKVLALWWKEASGMGKKAKGKKKC